MPRLRHVGAEHQWLPCETTIGEKDISAALNSTSLAIRKSRTYGVRVDK